MAHKRIVWTSWNSLVDEYNELNEQEMKQLAEDMQDMDMEQQIMMPMQIIPPSVQIMYTPWGPYPMDSMFKPSDRWDCRIGTTNFDITTSIKNILTKDISGIEALKIMGRYTFAIGIPITFDFREVRTEIEKKLCVYTEEEILTEETQATVDLVKEQLKNKKYWSILVAPTGKVDYVVSDKLDQKYLEGLNELVEIKQLLGGIILRGDNG
jgi:hypothetical protein